MSKEGMNYAPEGKPAPVCEAGDFPFAAVALDHGHIYGQCNGLREAGGTLTWVYDPDPTKVEAFVAKFPEVKVASSLEQILDDSSIKLVSAAAIPNARGPLGCQVMEAGKDYFTDKSPFTTLAQLDQAREVAGRTGKKYMVYYGERLHSESSIMAGYLIEQGAIGRVIQTAGFGPHRLSKPNRPGWFFDHDQYGGIICDIGSHQCEQFLYYTGAKDAKVNFAAVGNYANADTPGLEDFGEASFAADNGSSGYFRVDWFTPDGLRTWGDGRMIILGTKGYIELRKLIDVATDTNDREILIHVDDKGEHRIQCLGKVGYPFFGQLILDSLNRTETAMTQEHAFKAAEISMKAQEQALVLA